MQNDRLEGDSSIGAVKYEEEVQGQGEYKGSHCNDEETKTRGDGHVKISVEQDLFRAVV
jgi:hypothetical protein